MARTISRDRLVAWLDAYLDVAGTPDASPNGLQVEGRARVSRVAFAVDASVQTIRAAVRRRADMLVVHHGLWWGRHEPIVGTMRARIAALIRADLSLYAAHLPLDRHPEVGNNAVLARRLGVENTKPFGEYRGVTVGVGGELPGERSRERFVDDVAGVVGARPQVLPFGPARVRRVAIVSGAGASLAETARREGYDTLLTGETSHAAWHTAREAGVNVIFGGHYATETVGLEALAERVRDRFDVPTVFIDAPTGF